MEITLTINGEEEILKARIWDKIEGKERIYLVSDDNIEIGWVGISDESSNIAGHYNREAWHKQIVDGVVGNLQDVLVQMGIAQPTAEEAAEEATEEPTAEEIAAEVAAMNQEEIEADADKEYQKIEGVRPSTRRGVETAFECYEGMSQKLDWYMGLRKDKVMSATMVRRKVKVVLYDNEIVQMPNQRAWELMIGWLRLEMKKSSK